MKALLVVLMLGAGAESAPPAPKAGAPSKPKAASPKTKAAATPPPAPPPLSSATPLSAYLPSVEDEEEDAPPPSLLSLPPDMKVPPIYRQPFVWDIPRTLDIVDVPGVMLANGIPVRLKAVRSAEKVEPLIQHVVDRWIEWGLYLPPPEHQPQTLREATLTAVDPERLITYTVIVQPNPDGTTTLYLGEANMSRPPQAVSSVAPLMPGADGVLTSELEVVRSVNYSVKAKEAEVEAFYRVELGRLGFKQTEPRRFRSQTEEVELVLQTPKTGTTSVAVLRRTLAPEDTAKPAGD